MDQRQAQAARGLAAGALVMGELQSPDFSDCRVQIRQRTDAIEVADTEQALASAAQDPPDLIIIAAERPGGFSHRQVEAMRQAAPLAHIVGLLGSWCEGESRSGRPWPAVTRVYWHSWAAWFDREMSALAAGGCGTLSLPLTATDEERLLAAAGAVPARSGIAVRIHAASREAAGLLHAACESLGHRPVPINSREMPSNLRPQVGIWDAAVLDDSVAADLRAAVEHCQMCLGSSFWIFRDARISRWRWPAVPRLSRLGLSRLMIWRPRLRD